MKHIGLILSILAALALAWGAGAENNEKKTEASPLGRLSPEHQKLLLAGERVYLPKVVEEKGEKRFSAAAMIIVDKPVDDCFKLFCQFEKQYMYFPKITKSEVLSKSEDRVVIYKEADISITTISYTHILEIDQKDHRVDFSTDPSGKNTINFSRGFFQFEKIDDKRSLFTYELTEIDPGVDVPQFIQKFFTSRELPAMVVNLKKWIESDGTWKRED